MRTLHADLVAAQKAASREPYIRCTVENYLQWAQRLDFTAQHAPDGSTIAEHDVALAGGYLHHVRNNSGSLEYYRTDPATGPWAQWAQLVANITDVLAIAARGARVAIVYTATADDKTILLVESTDSGANFGAPVSVITAPSTVIDVTVAYKNDAGDLAVIWQEGTDLHARTRASGSWATAVAAGFNLATHRGVDTDYGLGYQCVVCGIHTDGRRMVWTAEFDDGAQSWGTLREQFAAEGDSLVDFFNPYIAHTGGLSWRMTFSQWEGFTGGTNRVWLSTMHPFDPGPAWNDYRWRQPVPLDYTGTQGLAIAGDLTYAFLAATDAVYRASAAHVSTDVAPDVLAFDVHEQPYATSGYIDLDNSSGAYTDAGVPFQLGNYINLDPGYVTSSGPRWSSGFQDLQIAAIEQRHDWERGHAVTRIHVEGYWEHLKRHRLRTQISYAAGTTSYLSILSLALARAGLRMITNDASARAGSVKPAFLVTPQQATYAQLRQLLAMLADRLRIADGAETWLVELVANDSAVYTFGTDHPVRQVRVAEAAPRVAHAEAFGAGAYGEAFDFAAAQAETGTRELVRDSNSTTAAAAAATAAARQRSRAADADGGELVAQPHVGLELYDVVGISDGIISPSTVTRRVAGIRWRFDRARATYEQHITLSAV